MQFLTFRNAHRGGLVAAIVCSVAARGAHAQRATDDQINAAKNAYIRQFVDAGHAAVNAARQAARETGDPAMSDYANRLDTFYSCMAREMAKETPVAANCPSPPSPPPIKAPINRVPTGSSTRPAGSPTTGRGAAARPGGRQPVALPTVDPQLARLEAQRRAQAKVQQFSLAMTAVASAFSSPTTNWREQPPEAVQLDERAAAAEAEQADRTVAQTFNAAVRSAAVRPATCISAACRARTPADVVIGAQDMLTGLQAKVQTAIDRLPPASRRELNALVGPWLDGADEALAKLAAWAPSFAPATNPLRNPASALGGVCDRSLGDPGMSASARLSMIVRTPCESIVQAVFALPRDIRQQVFSTPLAAPAATGDDYQTRLRRVMWLARNGDATAAADEVVSLIRAVPNRWEGFVAAADLASSGQRAEAAEAFLRAAQAVAPSPVQAKLEAAVREVRSAVTADSLARAAADAMVNGDFARAGQLYDLANAASANDKYQFGKTLAYYGQGLKEPVSTMLRVLRKSSDPEVAEGAHAFLDTLYLTGKVEEIRTFADSSAQQGLSAARSGNWQAALDLFEAAAADEPENARWWRAVGSARASLKRWPDAAEAYINAARLAPDDTTSFPNAGVAYYRAGQWQECVAAFQGAVNRAPRDAALRDGMGRCLIRLGDRAGATQAFDAAARLAPNNSRYRTTLDSLNHLPPLEHR